MLHHVGGIQKSLPNLAVCFLAPVSQVLSTCSPYVSLNIYFSRNNIRSCICW